MLLKLSQRRVIFINLFIHSFNKHGLRIHHELDAMTITSGMKIENRPHLQNANLLPGRGRI